MPKNLKKKANKDKARKQKGERQKRDLPIAGDQQLYAYIEKPAGDRRFTCICSDGNTRLGKLRGAIRKRKKSWVNTGRWVIVALRDFQEDKVDIVEILDDDEVKRLEIYGELSTKVISTDNYKDDGLIEFTNEEEVEFDIDDI